MKQSAFSQAHIRRQQQNGEVETAVRSFADRRKFVRVRSKYALANG